MVVTYSQLQTWETLEITIRFKDSLEGEPQEMWLQTGIKMHKNYQGSDQLVSLLPLNIKEDRQRTKRQARKIGWAEQTKTDNLSLPALWKTIQVCKTGSTATLECMAISRHARNGYFWKQRKTDDNDGLKSHYQERDFKGKCGLHHSMYHDQETRLQIQFHFYKVIRTQEHKN